MCNERGREKRRRYGKKEKGKTKRRRERGRRGEDEKGEGRERGGRGTGEEREGKKRGGRGEGEGSTKRECPWNILVSARQLVREGRKGRERGCKH